jgi:lipid A 3-O-deacylase
MRNIPFATVPLLALAFAASIQADMIKEVKGGILHHDADNLWSGSSRESGVDINAEVIFNYNVSFWGGFLSPALGLSVNNQGDTSKAYFDARWEKNFASHFFFALGIGAAVHNGNTKLTNTNRKALGSEVLLHFPLELGYRIDKKQSASFFFDHVSNAWSASPNEGMDTLGIRYGYRF